jgi:hypothetical protein
MLNDKPQNLEETTSESTRHRGFIWLHVYDNTIDLVLHKRCNYVLKVNLWNSQGDQI